MSEYSLDGKIARYLSETHGLTVTVKDAVVTSGSFSEKVLVASRKNLDEIALRIKVGNGL